MKTIISSICLLIATASSVVLYGQNAEIPGEAGKLYELAKVACEEKGEFMEAFEYLKEAERLLINEGQEYSKVHSKILVYMAEQILNISYTKMDTDTALSYLDKASEIHRCLNDKQSEEYIHLLNIYGVLARTTGDGKKAIEYFNTVLQIAGQSTIGYANAMHNIGLIYLYNRRYADALPYFEKSLEIKGKVLPYGHNSYINELCTISQCHVYLQDYEAAEKVLDINDELYQELKKRNAHILILHNRAYIYNYRGKTGAALEAFSEVVDIMEQYQNNKMNQSMYMTSLNGLGVIYRKIGEFAKAQEVYSKVEEFRVREYGENSLEAATVYGNRGVVYLMTSDYRMAEHYLLKAYNAIIDNDKSHYKEQSTICVNLANLYMIMRQYRKALVYAMRSCEIAEKQKKYGDQHILALSEVGQVYFRLKDYENALNFYDESLSNNKDQNGALFIGTVGHSAQLMYDLGCYEEALQMWQSAMKLAEESDVKHMVKYRMFQNGVIKSYIALDKLEQAWKESDILWGNMNINSFTIDEFLEISGNLLKLMDRFGMIEQGSSIVENMYNIIKADLSKHFIYMSEQERNFYVKGIHDIFVKNNSIAVKLREDKSGLLYNSCLFSKGLLLNASLSLEKNIYRSGDTLLLEDVRRVKRMRSYMKSTGDENTEIKTKAEALEKDVMERCRQKGISTGVADNVTYGQVAQALGKNDVAVEYVRYMTDEGKYRYAASVIRNDWKYPLNVDLCSEEDINAIKNTDVYRSSALFNMLIKPLSENFSESGTVWYSPDGLIHLVGLENLMDDKGMIMSDRYQVMRVTSTREVIGRNRSAGHDMVLFGGIDYNADVEDLYYNTNVSERGYAGGGRWTYLPGTDREVEAIAGKMRTMSYDISLFKADKAMEENIKFLSGHSPEILHIATHGFYMNDEENGSEKTGLVFAGANNSWNPEELAMYQLDDGILTGEEIEWLDLSSTDLVVLSACQTGIGNVDVEGMHGLQRAFKRAGAHSLMVSLWPVDDAATQALMERFYARLSEGWDKRDALKDAQKHIKGMTFRDSLGNEISGSDPHYWAAFVLLD